MSFWINGEPVNIAMPIEGPKGMGGNCTPHEDRALLYLEYRGIIFTAYLKKSTREAIENPPCITEEELSFIRVLDSNEWSEIRQGWCRDWHTIQAHKAFEGVL